MNTISPGDEPKRFVRPPQDAPYPKPDPDAVEDPEVVADREGQRHRELMQMASVEIQAVLAKYGIELHVEQPVIALRLRGN